MKMFFLQIDNNAPYIFIYYLLLCTTLYDLLLKIILTLC